MKINSKKRSPANVGLCLGILALLLCFASIFPQLAQAGPIMEVDATIYSAGEIYAGEVVEHRFRISNVGDDMLEVQRVRSS